jgi:gliding motility-associated-like protein
MRFAFLTLLFLTFSIVAVGQSPQKKYALTCLTTCVVFDAIKDAPKDISWTGPNGFTSNLAQPKVCETGTYNYSYQKNGVIEKGFVVVENQRVIPKATAGKDRELTCIFNCVELKGNDPGSNYGTTWYGPSSFVSNDLDVKICQPGRYIYEIFKGVCHSFDTVMIADAKIKPTVDAGDNIELNCKQPTAKPNATFPGNEYTYQWVYANDKTYSTQIQPTITQAGIYYFKIKRGSCEAKDSIKVIADFRKPTLKGTKNYQLPCSPKELSLDLTCAEKEATFEWKNTHNDLISNKLKEKFKQADTYFLQSYMPKNGCSDTLSIQVTKRDSISFEFTTLSACGTDANGVVELTKVGGGVPPYEISLKESGYEKRKSFATLRSDNYALFVRDQNGCVSVNSFSIGDKRPFHWTLPTAFEFCSYEQPLVIDATVKDSTAQDIRYTWSSGAAVPKHIFTTSEKVWVEASSNCYTEKKYIEIKDRFDAIKSTESYSPNVFNPLSINALNRCFKPFLGFPVQKYELNIYDRWGNQVFQTNDVEACWDGSFKGKSINFGTFFWQISALIDGCGYPVPWQKTGGITIFAED